MTYRRCKSVGCIEFSRHVCRGNLQKLLQHGGNLFLARCPVACDALLDFARRIFGYRNLTAQ